MLVARHPSNPARSVFLAAISYPTVPRGKDRIRVMNSATHSKNDLDFAAGVFEKVGKEIGIL